MEHLVDADVIRHFQKILLIDAEGNQRGVMPSNAALAISKQEGLNLVCVSPNAATPVCKLMDYGKYKFEAEKQAKAAKKMNKKMELKEVQITYSIDVGDLKTKEKTVARLVQEGNPVIIVLRLRGREMGLKEKAIEKLKAFVEQCSSFTKVKKDVWDEERDIKVILEKI